MELPLDPEQIARMVWLRLPDENRSVRLSHTEALEADFRKWLSAECKEHDHRVTEITASDGSKRWRKQCTICGLHEGSWIKKSLVDHASTVKGSADLFSSYESIRREEWSTVALKHYEAQHERNTLSYQQYLASEKWRERRALVIRRAGGLCEGCGTEPATEVHHLTYEHIYDEFLWELRAVCDDCHSRLHDGELDEDW